jgi:Holliday junction resolvasome RuvABC endonuclease subunit
MTILALDLGTTTGYAWKAAEMTIISGTWDLKPRRFEGGGMRFVRFREKLELLAKSCGIKTIYFEEVRRHLGTDAAHVYGGLMGVLTGWCEERNIPYEGIPVGTIKKFWTGLGNANKQQMIDEAVARGYAPVDDNEADAIALLAFKASHQING